MFNVGDNKCLRVSPRAGPLSIYDFMAAHGNGTYAKQFIVETEQKRSR